MPSCWQISNFTWTLTFGEKKIFDLFLLTFCPAISQKEPSAIVMASQFLVFAFANNNRLFAKKKKNVRESGSSWGCFHPHPLLRITQAFNLSIQILHTQQKMKGDSRSPYLIPLEGVKGGSFSPLKSREVKEEEMQLIINLVMFGGNPKQVSTFRMKHHSSLSYAFSKSILTTMNPSLPLRLFKE